MPLQSKPQEGYHLVSIIADSPEQCQKLHKDHPEAQCRRFASDIAVFEYLMNASVHGEFHYCPGVDTQDFFLKMHEGRDDEALQSKSSKKTGIHGITRPKTLDPLGLVEENHRITKVRQEIVALLHNVEGFGRFEFQKGGPTGFPHGGLRELASDLIETLEKKFPPHSPDPFFDEPGSPFQPGPAELEDNCRREVVAHRNRFLLDWEDHRLLLQRDHPGKYFRGPEPDPFKKARNIERSLQEARVRCFHVRMHQATSPHPMSEAEASAYTNIPAQPKTS